MVMNWLPRLQRRFRALFQKERLDARMDDEIHSHIELQTQENIEAGMEPGAARHAALRQFGWVESIKETCREQRGVRWIEDLSQDIRYGARMLYKYPGFSAVAILTLALGIGTNTAIFSVVDAVLLRPLAYPDSDQLVWLCERGPDWSGGSLSYPNFTDWRSQQSVFEDFGVYNGNSFTLTGTGEPVRLAGVVMSAEVFAALRTPPEMGRVFGADDDRPGALPVAVISHGLWQGRLGGQSDILHHTIRLDGKPYTILGVMPAGFEFPYKADVWVPLGPYSAQASWQKRDYHPGMFGLARLKGGVTLEQARANLDVVALRLEQAYPESNKTRGVQIERLLENKVGNTRRALWILFGAVCFVLVIACANVANLLLARAAAREREVAVRAALGAGRWRMTRQLLAESGLLAMLGMVVGLLFAKGTLRIVAALARENLPRAVEISLDPRVLLFSVLVAVVTGLLFGLAPVWHARRVDLEGTLKQTGRGNTTGRAGLRQGLVIAEVALTFVLLVGAGLLLRSFNQLLQVQPGFAVDRVLTLHLDLPEQKYQTPEQQVLFYHALLENVRALPGVQATSLTSKTPLDDNGWDMLFLVEGRPEPPPHLQPSLRVHLVAPDYFRAMGIPLLQGRDFTEQDNREHLRSAPSPNDWGAGLNAIIIDDEFARRYWPNQSPLGQRVRLPWGEREKQPVMTVVGVVGRIKENRLSEQGGMVQAYFPMFQQPLLGLSVVVKTTHEPAGLLARIRQQLGQLDPAMPLFGISTMKELRDRNVAPNRLNLGLLGGFAVLALFLALIGLYGLLSFIVTQRQREIGVRMALGAQRFEVLNSVVGQGMRLVLTGAVIGLLGAVVLTRVLTSVLFQVEPNDPLTLVSVTLSLCLVALLACYIPARRATKIDPMVALRYE
jgi:putative ABC transport system permease protein